MLPLLIAAAGRTLGDQEHWPALPALWRDDYLLHVDGCTQEQNGPLRAQPRRVYQNPELRWCSCLSQAQDVLGQHPAASELTAASATCEAMQDITWWLGRMHHWWLNVDYNPDAEVHARDRLPLTDSVVSNIDLLDSVANALDCAANVLARAGTLPARIATDLLPDVHECHRLHAAAARVLAGVYTDPVLTDLSNRLLSRPVSGHGWWFAAPSDTGHVGTPGMLWPDHTARVRVDGQWRVASRVPAAFALAWRGVSVSGSGGEFVTTDRSLLNVQRVGQKLPRLCVPDRPVPVADLGRDTVEVALQLWTPPTRRESEPGGMDASTALFAAAGILTPART